MPAGWSQALESIVTAMSTPVGLVALVYASIAMVLGLISSFVKWAATSASCSTARFIPSMIMLVLHGLLLPINLVRHSAWSG